MGVNTSYASTIPAVFKILEAIINIIIIILVAVAQNYRSGPEGWLLFVAIASTIVSLFFYIVHITNIIYKLSGPMTFIEFICITICAVFHLTCMITAAATAVQISFIIASAVLHAINMVIYGVDAFFLFALYKVHGAYLNNPAVRAGNDGVSQYSMNQSYGGQAYPAYPVGQPAEQSSYDPTGQRSNQCPPSSMGVPNAYENQGYQ